MRSKLPEVTKKITPQELGIDLSITSEQELFKWFLVSLLFGKPISLDIVESTFFEFVREEILSPEAILAVGWDRLVEVLDRGHYVRYDFSTATKLLEIARELQEKYDGHVANIFRDSPNRNELIKRLMEIKHIGPVTAQIFVQGLAPNDLENYRRS